MLVTGAWYGENLNLLAAVQDGADFFREFLYQRENKMTFLCPLICLSGYKTQELIA